MDMLNVLDLVSINEDRTEADRSLAQKEADDARALAVGAAILGGKSVEEAQAIGEEAAVRPRNNYRIRYELNSDEVYPAAVAWLRGHGRELVSLSMSPTADLVTYALNGDKAAAFVLKCQQYAPSSLTPLLMDWDTAWDLAETPRREVSDEEAGLRERALEAARLFVTEVIHQATGQAIGLHWTTSDAWKL